MLHLHAINTPPVLCVRGKCNSYTRSNYLSFPPGAIRQHVLLALRKQVSDRRAEERRAIEEVRRMYSEDVEEDEEEREMTGEGSLLKF